MAMPQAIVGTELGQPASTPDQVTKDRIEKHGHKEGIDKKGEVLPALSHRPGGDIVGRIHEDLLKEKDGEDSDVIRRPREEKPRPTKETKGFTEQREGDLSIQDRGPSERANRS